MRLLSSKGYSPFLVLFFSGFFFRGAVRGAAFGGGGGGPEIEKLRHFPDPKLTNRVLARHHHQHRPPCRVGPIVHVGFPCSELGAHVALGHARQAQGLPEGARAPSVSRAGVARAPLEHGPQLALGVVHGEVAVAQVPAEQLVGRRRRRGGKTGAQLLEGRELFGRAQPGLGGKAGDGGLGSGSRLRLREGAGSGGGAVAGGDDDATLAAARNRRCRGRAGGRGVPQEVHFFVSILEWGG